MSDFTSGFWSLYVALLTIASIAGCGWLLYANSRARTTAPKQAGASGVAARGTTGHTWDGDLTEYNNPLPRWWLNLFWITLVFGVAYLAAVREDLDPKTLVVASDSPAFTVRMEPAGERGYSVYVDWKRVTGTEPTEGTIALTLGKEVTKVPVRVNLARAGS